MYTLDIELFSGDPQLNGIHYFSTLHRSNIYARNVILAIPFLSNFFFVLVSYLIALFKINNTRNDICFKAL